MIDDVPENPVAMASARDSLDGPITGRLHFSAKAVAALGLIKEAGTFQVAMVLCGRRQNGGKTAAGAMEDAAS